MSSARVGHAGATVTIAAFSILAAAKAGAVSPAAEALFREGRQLMAAGSIATACARFAESYALEAASGTLLNLALCHETEGKTATAWGEYRTAARLAHEQGREDRAATAEGKAAALEPRVSHVTLVAPNPVPGLEVVSEAGPLSEAGLGVAVPIDPGVHQITARAPGYRSCTFTLEIGEGEQSTREIPALEEEQGRPVAPPPVEARTEPPRALVAAGPQPRRSSFELYTAVVGGSLLVAGSVLYVIAYSKFDMAKDLCNQPPGCSVSQRDGLASTVETLQYVGIGAWVAGGGLLMASGLHHWLGKATKTPLTVAIDPWNEAISIRAAF